MKTPKCYPRAFSVIPHHDAGSTTRLTWIPAFAGMTVLVFTSWLSITPVLAQGLGLPSIVPGSDQAPSANVYTGTAGEQTAGDRYATGDYTLCDFLSMLAVIVQIMFQIAAGGAIFLFLWTAFGMITNFGDTEKAQKSFSTLRHIFYGLVIMLGAWFMVNAIIYGLTSQAGTYKEGSPNTSAQIFDKPWNNLKGICPNN